MQKIFTVIGIYNGHEMVRREYLSLEEAENALRARMVFCANYDRWYIEEREEDGWQ